LEAQARAAGEAAARVGEEAKAAAARASQAASELEHARAALHRAGDDKVALQAQLEAAAAAASAAGAAAAGAAAAAGRSGAYAGAVGSSAEEELRKQVEQLQAMVQDVKSRAKEAIKEAFKTASKTVGEGRARTASLDSVEAGTARDGGGSGALNVTRLARQVRSACAEAVTKRDTAGLYRLRVIFGLIVYVGIVHLGLLSVWWSCRA